MIKIKGNQLPIVQLPRPHPKLTTMGKFLKILHLGGQEREWLTEPSPERVTTREGHQTGSAAFSRRTQSTHREGPL